MYFFMTLFVYSFDKQALTGESVNEYWEDISFWEHGSSSKLIEQGYLIHGGDGSFMNPEQFDTIDKGKGIIRFKSTTQGCNELTIKMCHY